MGDITKIAHFRQTELGHSVSNKPREAQCPRYEIMNEIVNYSVIDKHAQAKIMDITCSLISSLIQFYGFMFNKKIFC